MRCDLHSNRVGIGVDCTHSVGSDAAKGKVPVSI
jgi:hypothetical protein